MKGFRSATNGFVQSGTTVAAIDIYRNAYLFTCRVKNNGHKPLQVGDVMGLRSIVNVQSPGRVAVCQFLNGEVF